VSFGIYKPGQGYWVRTISAVFAGALVLSAAVWAWQQASIAPLPTPTWRISLAGIDGDAPSAGDTVVLYDVGVSPREVIGTGVVQNFDATGPSRGDALIGDLNLEDRADPALTGAVEAQATGDAEPAFEAEVDGNPQGQPPFERIYLQGAAAGVVVLLGAILTFVLIGSKKSTAEFLINTDGEMKKVNWSTKREIYGSTVVVIVATFLIAAILFVIDFGFSWVARQVGILEI